MMLPQPWDTTTVGVSSLYVIPNVKMGFASARPRCHPIMADSAARRVAAQWPRWLPFALGELRPHVAWLPAHLAEIYSPSLVR